MKLHLPLLLLAALSASFAPAATYLAKGVNSDDLVHSERFYDTGKGYYWRWMWDAPYLGAKALYEQTGNYDFLGSLLPRINPSSTFSTSVFENLTEDSDTCWYNAATNLIQYWMSYYGVFYKGSRELPYGFTYDREYLDDLGGTHSLEVSLAFYDAWTNQGYNLGPALEWFFKGKYDAQMEPTAMGTGGYFSEYFANTSATKADYRIYSSVSSLKQVVITSLGWKEGASGQLLQQEQGCIVYFSLRSSDGVAGHAITCYGIETAADGSLTALYCANSDDEEYSLFPLYVRERNGKVFLFSDAACTQLWMYASMDWYIDGVGCIRTPEVLKEMYAEYHNSSNPLVWNGKGEKGWTSSYTRATTDALPDSTTGWDIAVKGDLFPSYYETNRPLLFDDRAASCRVSVSGTLQVPEVILSNKEQTYIFSGNGAVVKAPLTIRSSGCSWWYGITLQTGNVNYDSYYLRFATGSQLKAGSGVLGSQAVLSLDGGSAVFSSSLSLSKNAALAVTASSSLQAANLRLQDGSLLYFAPSAAQTSSSLLSYTGSITMAGVAEVLIGGSSLVDGTRYRLMTLNSGADSALTEYLGCDMGTLSISGNVLYLTYSSAPKLSWERTGGTWSATSWSGNSRRTDNADLVFTTFGGGNIVVNGTVNPRSVEVRSGNYSFQEGTGSAINIADRLTVRGTANLTTSVPIQAAQIELRGAAGLTYALRSPGEILALDAAEGTTLAFTGSSAYTLRDSRTLAGAVSLTGTTSLTLALNHDVTIGGLLSSTSGTSLTFANRAGASPVTYTVSKGLNGLAGAVTVGGGSGPVVLRTTGTLRNAVSVGSGSVLELVGNSTCSASLSGSGTVRIASGAQSVFTPSDGKAAIAASLGLDVIGNLTIGSGEALCSSAALGTVRVSGSLTAVRKSGSGSCEQMELNGGHYSLSFPFASGYSDNVVERITNLTVGPQGGVISLQHENTTAYYVQSFLMQVNRLSGSGDLELTGDYFLGQTHYSIASTAAEDYYRGSITLHNTLSRTNSNNQLSLELGNCSLTGSVSLRTDLDSELCHTALGITGRAIMRGLDSDGRGDAYLYSGAINNFRCNIQNEMPEAQITVAPHLLQLYQDDEHRFSGKVLGPLHLALTGTGTQYFTGDMSGWSGDLTVWSGRMVFGNELTVKGKLTMTGGILEAGRLVTSAGAEFSGHATLRIDSAQDDSTWTFNVSAKNAAAPVLTLESLHEGPTVSFNRLNVTYDAAAMYNGSYQVLGLSPGLDGQYIRLTLQGGETGIACGTDESSLFYYANQEVDGRLLRVLMLSVQDGKLAYPRYDAATLTWNAASGIWAVDSGHVDGAWRGSENNNFLNGDSVVFNSAATVSIRGEVNPASVRVQHESGTLVLSGKDSAAALIGNGALTKSGAGTLQVNTANRYTGGTTLTGGVLAAGTATAFGTGTISVQGGTLSLGSAEVSNAVYATGGTLTGTAYRGALTVAGNVSLGNGFTAKQVTLQSGTLSGSLANAPLEVRGGTLTAALSGSSSVTSSGNVVMSGSSSYTGGTLVKSGTLSAGSANAFGSGTVTLESGTLALGAYAVANAVNAASGTLTGTAYRGALTVAGNVSLGSGFTAKQVTLQSGTLSGSLTNSTVIARGGTLAAALSGNTSVQSNGSVTLSGSNTHTGGTTVTGGTLTVKHAQAFGTGSVTVTGGTLAMGSNALANAVYAQGGTLTGTAYRGALTVAGNVLLGNGFTAQRVTLQSGTLSGNLTNASIETKGGTLSAAVSGNSSVTSSGNVALSGSNTYTGGTTVAGGTLTAGSAQAFGSGTIALNGGTLDMGHYAVSNKISATGGTLVGTAYAGALTIGSGTVAAGRDFTAGSLTLDGGTLVLAGGTPITVSGAVTLQSASYLDVSAYTTVGTYTLMTAELFSGLTSSLTCRSSVSGRAYTLSFSEHELLLQVQKKANYWSVSASKMTIRMGMPTSNGEKVLPGDVMTIRNAAKITFSGPITLENLTTQAVGNITFAVDKKTAGSRLSGNLSLVKNNIGMLTMNAGNTYTGGTTLNEGTLKATAADSFGSGVITVNGGTLDLGSKAVGNDIVLAGSATIKGDAKYTGTVSVEGEATLLGKASYKGMTTIGDGSKLTLAETATMAGSLTINGGEWCITSPKGLKLGKNQVVWVNGGAIKGQLILGSGSLLVGRAGTVSRLPVLKGGSIDLGSNIPLLLTGSDAQVQFGGLHITMAGKGCVYSGSDLILNRGTVTVNTLYGYKNAMTVESGTLKLTTGNETTLNEIKVTGSAAVVNGTNHIGNLTVDGLLAKGTNIKLNSVKQSIALNGAGTMLGTISGAGIVNVNASIDATAAKITAARINLNSGTFTNTKGIKLAKGQTLTLGGVALKLGPTGALATAAGSTLVVNGGNTLSGSLTLGGGALAFGSGSLSVNGMLTLSKAMTVSGSGSITYTALKPYKGDIATFFGGASVVQKGNTLTFNGGAPKVVGLAAEPAADAAPVAIGEETEELASAPLDAEPVALAMPAPAANPVADAVVQADWGIIDAERAFLGAVNSRYQHAAMLDKGRGAAWVSAFGASVRHGSQGVHHGSDGNIEGAAFGLEHAVSETGSLGLAVGRSKNRIAATGVTHLRQETAHVALYGQKQLAHGFTADAAATYGDTETKLGAASWQQKSAALTARLTHAQQLTDATAFRTFGGLAYEATDAGSIGTAHTGSVQNFRGELGAGITHTAGKAHLYAEAALTGDMVRHTPTADLGGFRTHGANPGRIGIRATLGGLYEFTDTWSGTASYGIEAESRSTAHTLNIGVSKTF